MRTYPGGIYSLTVSIGFAECKLDIIDVVHKIMEQYIENPLDLTTTLYQSNHSIKVINKTFITRWLLFYYSNLKLLFHNNLSYVKVKQGSTVDINFVVPL